VIYFWMAWNLVANESFMPLAVSLEQYDRREQLKKSGLGKVCLYQPLLLAI